MHFLKIYSFMFPYAISMSFELPIWIININFESYEYGHFSGIKGFFVMKKPRHDNKKILSVFYSPFSLFWAGYPTVFLPFSFSFPKLSLILEDFWALMLRCLYKTAFWPNMELKHVHDAMRLRAVLEYVCGIESYLWWPDHESFIECVSFKTMSYSGDWWKIENIDLNRLKPSWIGLNRLKSALIDSDKLRQAQT